MNIRDILKNKTFIKTLKITLWVIGITFTIFSFVVWILSSKGLILYNDTWASVIGKLGTFCPTLLGIVVKLILGYRQSILTERKTKEVIESAGLKVPEKLTKKQWKELEEKQKQEEKDKDNYHYI